MNISDFSIDIKELKLPETELFLINEKSTKLIYQNLTHSIIAGLSDLLNGKIVEIIETKIYKQKKYYKVKYNEEVIGWILLEDSIRLYRIPRMFGKAADGNIIQFSFFPMKTTESEYLNKFLEARYYFEYNEVPGLVINILGKRKEIVPINFNSFNRYQIPPKNTKVSLEADLLLYSKSDFLEVSNKLECDKEMSVIGYYENTNEIKIKRENGEKFWAKHHHKFEKTSAEHTIKNIEIIDKVMYLENRIKNLENQLNNQLKVNDFIKSNISINSDLDSLFVTKYLGDIDEME